MAEFFETALNRRSVRKFEAEMPEISLIDRIIEAGKFAPTGMNRQSPIIIAITNPETREQIVRTNAQIGGWKADFDPFYGAPVILAVLESAASPTRVYDGSCVMQNLLLAAADVGLGGCWIHRAKETFERQEWREWLAKIGVEGEFEGIGFCAIGHISGENPKPHKRKENWVYWVK